jgi:hypothetical protein
VLSQRASAMQPIRDREVLAVSRAVKAILSDVHAATAGAVRAAS